MYGLVLSLFFAALSLLVDGGALAANAERKEVGWLCVVKLNATINEYGLLVVDVAGDPPPLPLPSYQPLEPYHLVDIIWIPHGAMAVRSIPRTKLAVVVDGLGHVLLVDLSRIDERWGIEPDALFPTARSILEEDVLKPDPRIVWRSDEPLASGTLAPVVDADRGLVFAGKLLEKTTNVVSAIDPRILIKADTGAAGGLSEIGGIVPLGVAPPPGVPLTGPNASLSAFRLEVTLSGAMNESLAGETFTLTLDSERVFGAKTEDTPPGWPRAHLQVQMQRVVPASMTHLRYQRGYNKWVSPWIVGIADIRASEKWPLGSEKCVNCERPPILKGRPDVLELYSTGSLIAIRPDPAAFAGTPYEYLTREGRLETRAATVPADTVRPREVQIAAQNPPVAGGALLETTYLHSGEISTSTIDLDAGGRAGLNVIVDRTYLSRTIGGTPFGAGWDSTLFRRLRPLPNGNVEYRDGSGEVWVFTRTPVGYEAPRGLFLKLVRAENGYVLLDQQRRETSFDALGRITAETDHLYDRKGGGNITRYLYDASGRLVRIIDPVLRETTIRYNTEGYVEEIADWRRRSVRYAYDAGRLLSVELPEAKAADGVPAELDHTGAKRPRIAYTYDTDAGSSSFNDALELKTNLATIKHPAKVGSAGPARVRFNYTPSGDDRDRVKDQTWATGESATFTYSGAAATVVDALGQTRTYTLTDAEQYDKRVHVLGVTAQDVDFIEVEPLPASASPVMDTKRESLLTLMSYTDDGQVLKVFHPNGLTVESTYEAASSGAPGKVLAKIEESGPGFTGGETHFTHDSSSNQVESVGRSEGGSALETRSTPQVTREKKTTVITDEGIKITTKYNAAGQTTDVLQSPEGSDAVISAQTVYYGVEGSTPITRGRPYLVIRGNDGEKHNFLYQVTADGGERIQARDMIRGTLTETTLDSFGRTIRTVATDAHGAVLADERFGYDASGRLAYSARAQKGVGTVETRVTYDALGREIETSTTHAAVNGSPATLETTTSYDLSARTITQTDPTSGETVPAEQVTTLDKLGRPVEIVRRGASAQTVTQRFAYDKTGVRSFESDGARTAIVSKQDALGRTIATVASDGTKTETTYDQWSKPQQVTSFDASGAIAAQTRNFFTTRGRVKSVNEAIGATARKTSMTWREGGKKTVTRVGEVPSIDVETLPTVGRVRAQQLLRDAAGHVVEERIGELSPAEVFVFDPDSTSETWTMTKRTFIGAVPVEVRASEPKAGSDVGTTMIVSYDGLDRPIEQTLAFAYSTKTTYDEAENALSVKRPGMSAETASYDSRGLVTKRTLADGKTNEYRYDALGNVREVIDESGESTFYDFDPLGRLSKVRYADGTFEETVYEDKTGAITATRDRGGQWLSYSFDDGGRVVGVHKGEAPTPEALLIKYEYDEAGRLKLVRNKDAGIGYDEYDLLGRPRVTRAHRYLAGTGLESTPVLLDVHSQRHTWSIYDGERASWHMPIAGATAPLLGDPGSPWLRHIVETRDAGSNLIAQTKSTGGDLSSATARSAGRLLDRRQHLATGSSIVTAYGFADGKPLPASIELPPLVVGSTLHETGLPLWSETSVGSARLAGSANMRDDALRLRSLLDLGTRKLSAWGYDDRGRLRDTWLNVESAFGTETSSDTLIDADFRVRRDATPALTPSQHAVLGAEAAEIEPLTWSATRASAHRIDTRTLSLDDVELSKRTYAFAGGRRTNDGVWKYTFDELGRMTSATSADRRIELAWDPNDRLVGRVAYEPDGAGGWLLETRTNVLARDGLPAATTFVWDPIVDRLVAMYRQGESTISGAAPTAGLLRQYLHGDKGYDDPTRVFVAQANGDPATYFPVADEAGTGSLSAVIDANGDLLERVLYADAYGDAPRYLQGAVADKIALQVRKDGAGNLESVNVRVHLSERIDASTLATGTRLASVKADNSLAQLSSVAAELEDDFTILWSLAPPEWNALAGATDAASLEVSLTSALHAEGWGATPVTAVPSWARKIYSGADATTAQPVIYRESLSSISSFASTIGASDSASRNLYQLDSLYLAASDESKAKLLFDFKLLFREPATQLVYARQRWLSTADGQLLTPDPMGAVDSNNLYVFCGAAPVECNDPLGAFGEDAAERQLMFWFAEKYATDEGFRNNVDDVAYAVGETLANPYVQGTLQLVGGCGEALVGGVAVWTGAGTVPGAVAVLHGGDICLAGLRTVITGQTHESFFDQGSMYALQKSGLSETQARWATLGLNVGLGAYAGGGSSRAVRETLSFDDVADAGARGLDEGVSAARAGLAPAITRPQANLGAGNVMEGLAKRIASGAGETIIESQFPHGAAMRGFDFLSFTGRGRSARLFINEVKNEAGRVGSRRFTAFGLGRSGRRSFDEAFLVARQRIAASNIDDVTRQTLIRQLDLRTARIRLIGGQKTIFDPRINQAIGARTGS